MTGGQYHFVEDCPNCGEKDELNQWKGARMHSSSWGHPYACCSDACGVALKKSRKLKELTLMDKQIQLSGLRHELSVLEKEIGALEAELADA